MSGKNHGGKFERYNIHMYRVCENIGENSAKCVAIDVVSRAAFSALDIFAAGGDMTKLNKLFAAGSSGRRSIPAKTAANYPPLSCRRRAVKYYVSGALFCAHAGGRGRVSSAGRQALFNYDDAAGG